MRRARRQGAGGADDIAGVGRFAVLQDPQGAFFNIIDYLDT
ncbi:hypothetical protein [Sphaerotilus uruguayifluvii]|uniref:Enzyme related to lactoylglutathione lyase n=1 Tax=Sphaerotilus uruguayifluvii TaxID=2735897 RepID=A0ABX2G1N9_9BURK|nr:hypothetical protein [Leptothrix sp. C29]NRT56209.1 putative enzyme related to lactoylglutathione lyase [Leptothrix sp. C29]